IPNGRTGFWHVNVVRSETRGNENLGPNRKSRLKPRLKPHLESCAVYRLTPAAAAPQWSELVATLALTLALLTVPVTRAYGSPNSPNPLLAMNASCPGLDYSTLLTGTLQSMYSFIDPLTGLLHDHRAFLDTAGNAPNPMAGVFPDVPNADLNDAHD